MAPALAPAGAGLEPLPAGRWVQLHDGAGLGWTRQAHSGAAWDSRRGLLLLFGSDTHGRNHDNAVRAFDPAARRWLVLAPGAGPRTYRADPVGRAVAGTEQRLVPWAMHTYDLVLYDPLLDALWVAGVPEHNPARKGVRGVRVHPHWLFRIAVRRWEPFPAGGARPPRLFGGAMAYDVGRQTLVAFRPGQVLELGPDRERWRVVRPRGKASLTLHQVAVYAPDRRAVYLFGHYREARREVPFRVRVYHPGERPYAPGRWEILEPKGRCPPPWQHFPVAYDGRRFVMVVPDRRVVRRDRQGRPWYGASRRARTYLWDPVLGRCRLLDGAVLPPGAVGPMNYHMVWAERLQVMLLVGSDRHRRPVVWALRPPP